MNKYSMNDDNTRIGRINWIKCDESEGFLPDLVEPLLVCIKDDSADTINYYVDIGLYVNNVWIVNNDKCYNVTYWAHFPDPIV